MPASRPETTSVSMRSPTIAELSECASIAFRAERIMSGFGLPTKYGSTPVARLISAATEPVAGSGPSGVGPVGSGLVAMKRAPRRHEADRSGDVLEAVGPGLPEDDVVRAPVGERVADRMERGRQTRLADDERRAAAAGRRGSSRSPSRRSRSAPPGPRDRSPTGGRPGRAGCTSSCWSGRGTAARALAGARGSDPLRERPSARG